MAKKKLTILHSNDLHGDFLPKEKDGIMTGGLVRLSGYVKRARAEEDNVLYLNAGDMFRGSIIDSEYMGLSTINLMNTLRPDVSIIGNHEVDYGVAHLLFLEKCARFPIINADVFVTLNNARLFRPYINLEVGGMRIMVIGILTRESLASTRMENVIGNYIDIEQAAKEVGVICDNYRTRNTDLVILLTHIGIEEDRKLANALNPDWGVDMIIGGHSHTFMEEPVMENGIPIVQAGTGSGQIGRFDIEYDTFWNKINSMEWRCQPINEETAPEDEIMADLLNEYRGETDKKYRRVVTTFARKLTHPARNQETEMGNLYADLIQWESSFDIEYDTFWNKINSIQWRCQPINEETAPEDEIMAEMLDEYRGETDKKYRRVVTTFARKLTHPARNQETEMGNLYADLIQWESSFDIMMMGSGAIRKKEMGPVVEYQDVLENTPFDDVLWMLKVTGAQFRRMLLHIFRDDAWLDHTEFYQFSKGCHFVYRKSTHTLEECTFRGKEIGDDQKLLIAIQNYHYNNFDEFLGVPLEEVKKNMRPRVVATSVNNLVEEYFATHQDIDAHVEGRIVILE